jgi:hypothetical protein
LIASRLHIGREKYVALMGLFQQTSNYQIIKNAVGIDFEREGITFKPYFDRLMEISLNCRIQ